MSAKHSALPWAVCSEAPNDHWHPGQTIYSVPEGTRVADTCFLDSRAGTNARLIARAVNNHERLVAALRDYHDDVAIAGHCELCDRHAPKDDATGILTGPINHEADCSRGVVEALLAEIAE